MNKKLLALACIIFSLLSVAKAQAAEACADDYYIDQTMPNGARWDMCWTHDAAQGIRYHNIHYTPKDESRRMVLYDASVAQIHVPYDDNGARYHDVSDYGLGDENLLSLSAGDCVGGNRGYYNSKAAICRSMSKDGNAYRHTDVRRDLHMLKVFSVSRVGEYLYSAEWRFYSDGRIVPSIIATGALQRFGGTSLEQHGWLIAGGSSTSIGLSHMHNFYWRLDFDLNGTGTNDQVQEINYSPYGGKRYKQLTQFSNEAARSVNPATMRSWLIKDEDATNRKGHNISYEIRLNESGQREIGPSFESFTENDFYVSKSKTCEKVASHNKRVYDCDTDNLKEFVNGESIEGQDIVAWVGVSFYHMPRSEDAPYMDAHVSSYEIVSRDWHTVNPSLDYVPPVYLRLSATDDYATAYASGALDIDAMGNDTGSSIVFNTLDNPDNGTATIVNNKIRYVADSGFRGTDIFWYSIKDASGAVFGARIHVTVTDANTGGGNSGVSTGSSGGGAMHWLLLLGLSLLACASLRKSYYYSRRRKLIVVPIG